MASPTLLAPNSEFMDVSDSSNSPQSPQTPRLYGRTRPRYPQELGRVPLHRRGTSKTYERLEDLLKEAGYKETRIFTPETERADKCEDDDDDATVVEDKRTSMMKEVVGFLAGFIPGVGASLIGSGAETIGSKIIDPSAGSQTPGIMNPLRQSSPPLSPLAHKATLLPLPRHEQQPHHVKPHPTTQSERPQIVIHPTTPHQNHARGQHHQPYQGPPSHGSVDPYSRHPAQHEKSHGVGLISGSNTHLSPHTTTSIHSPRPSRATAYLRHISSAPSVIPKRPKSTPAGLSHPQSRSGITVSLNETCNSQNDSTRSNEQQPPLPTSWLEMVAKAVLFGGAGAHVGGPLDSHKVTNVDTNHHEHRASVRQLRPSRSSLSQVSHKSRYYSHHRHHLKKSTLPTDRSGLSDSTNLTPSTATSTAFLPFGLTPEPPALFAQIERGRADKFVNEVCLTRVMCRSAPGSRSGSLVRSEGVWMGMKSKGRNLDVEWDVEREREDRGRGVKRQGGARGGWLKRREKEKLRVPSLARTHVEGDVWSSNMKTRKRSRPESGPTFGNGHGFGKGFGKCTYASEGEFTEHEGYSDETEEDEDEEEGEVNLARILLPPKRQNSIRSLRKHLLANFGGAHTNSRRPASANTKGEEDTTSVNNLLQRQTSRATSLTRSSVQDREEDHVFEHGTRHNNEQGGRHDNHINPTIVQRSQLNAGNSEERNGRASSSDDVEPLAGLLDVGGRKGFVRDPMGSGRSSTSERRVGIGSVWDVIGGGGS